MSAQQAWAAAFAVAAIAWALAWSAVQPCGTVTTVTIHGDRSFSWRPPACVNVVVTS